jgi:hypothetical protein
MQRINAWPLAARVQQASKPVRIGYLSATSAPDALIDNFREGMADIGYLEGRDFVIEARFAHRALQRANRRRLPFLPVLSAFAIARSCAWQRARRMCNDQGGKS